MSNLKILLLPVFIICFSCTPAPFTGGGDAGFDAGSDGGEDAGTRDTETESETDSEDGIPVNCTYSDDFSFGSCPNISIDDPGVRYVNAQASVGGDGKSWSSAFIRIQDAINAAACVCNTNTDATCQVWVARETYYIFSDSRCDTVWLKSDVSVYGGFLGAETLLEERAMDPASTIIDGRDGLNAEQHVLHVVSGAKNATISGFTITGGMANGVKSPHYYGGGIINWDVETTIANCIIINNVATKRGGGIYNTYCSPIIKNCVIAGNSAGDGGGVCNSFSQPVIYNTTFVDNQSTSTAGAMANWDSNPTIYNSIVWGNPSGGIVENHNSTSFIYYSDIQGWYVGEGVIDEDPGFVSISNGDYRLTSSSPCIDSADGDFALIKDILGNERYDDPSTSNTGKGVLDYTDMGAYEYR